MSIYLSQPNLGTGIHSTDSLADGLVSFWPFNENGGLTLNDLGDTPNQGTLVSMESPNPWSYGPNHGALNFDGSNDRILMANTGLVNSTRVSVVIWVYHTAGDEADSRMLVRDTTWSTADMDLLLSRVSSTGFRSRVRINGTTQTDITDALIVDDVWLCFAVTFDGSTVKHFRNGILRNSFAHSGDYTERSDREFRIGAGNNSSGTLTYGHWSGKIGPTYLYGRALTDSEVRELYENPNGVFKTSRRLLDEVGGTLFTETFTDGLSNQDTMAIQAGKVEFDGAGMPDSMIRSITGAYSEIQEVLSSLINQTNITQLNAQDLVSSIQSQINAQRLDTFGLPDSITRAITTAKTDTFSMSDSVTKLTGVIQLITFLTSDSLALQARIVPSELLTSDDSMVLDPSKSQVDGLDVSDSKAVLLSLFTDDAQQFNDSASLLAFITQLSQAAYSEDLTLDGQLIRSASVEYLDSLNNSVSVTLGEIFELLDALETSFLQFVTFLDGIEFSESTTLAPGKAPIDTASLLDSLTSTITTAVTETVSWLPYLNYLTATTKTDAEGFVDSLVSQTVQSLIESVGYDDAIQASIKVLRSDITALLDTIARTTFETFSETFQLSDAVASSIVTIIIGHVSAILVKALYNVEINIKPTYSIDIEVK